jgi:hypothetical protein
MAKEPIAVIGDSYEKIAKLSGRSFRDHALSSFAGHPTADNTDGCLLFGSLANESLPAAKW